MLVKEKLELLGCLENAKTLIGFVENCLNDPEQEDITDHYDCKSELKEAIEELQEVVASI